MSSRDYDMVVIGSGSAGLTAAKSAANWGARVALVEKGMAYGGDCTWSGCVPSKALIRCASACHEAKTCARFGITGVDPEKVKCDWPAIQKHIRESQQFIYDHDDSPKVLQDVGVVTIVNRKASFVDKYTVKLEQVIEETAAMPKSQENNETRDTITADTFVICTGAGPFCPPIPGLSDVSYMTYEDIWHMKEFPDSLMVIGGGPIGSELAQSFRRLGSEVTILDSKLMAREDDDVREVMEAVFAQDGVKVVQGHATKIHNGGKGIVVESTNKLTNTVQEVSASHLLVASGRRPRGLEALALDKAGVKWSPKGLEVDSTFHTNVPHIFACGDCIAGGMQFTHLAGYQAAQAAFNALMPFGLSALPNNAVPRCTFTHPEVATVGFTESEAVAKFGASGIQVVHQKLSETDRAVCEGEVRGFIKIITNQKRVILGATIVAPVAGEMAQELGLAISKGMAMKDLAASMKAYPTWSFNYLSLGADLLYKDLGDSSAFKCFRRCCARRLKGNPASLASVEMKDLRPH